MRQFGLRWRETGRLKRKAEASPNFGHTRDQHQDEGIGQKTI